MYLFVLPERFRRRRGEKWPKGKAGEEVHANNPTSHVARHPSQTTNRREHVLGFAPKTTTSTGWGSASSSTTTICRHVKLHYFIPVCSCFLQSCMRGTMCCLSVAGKAYLPSWIRYETQDGGDLGKVHWMISTSHTLLSTGEWTLLANIGFHSPCWRGAVRSLDR